MRSNRLSYFWFYYRQDLDKWLQDSRYKLLTLIVGAGVTMASFLSTWWLLALTIPFVYSISPAYKNYKHRDSPAVVFLDWSGTR